MSECNCHIRFRVEEFEMLQLIESKIECSVQDQSDLKLLTWVKDRLQEAHDYLELNECYCE
jgi:hypothetical protein